MLDRVDYAGENDTAGFSQQLWRGVDFRDMMVRPNLGTYEFDNFTSPVLPSSAATPGATNRITNTAIGAGAPTTVMASEAGGVWRLITTGTINTGLNVQMQNGTTGARHSVPTAGKLVFEARVRVVNSSTSPLGVFVGLAPQNTTAILQSTGAIASSGSFAGIGSATNLTLTGVGRNSATATTTASMGAFVENTFVKLGLMIENGSRLSFWVNGVRYDSMTTSTNIISGLVVPTFAIVSGGTTTHELDIDWYGLACQNLIQ